MSLLFRIVYAAHANGTHHKLALDALQGLQIEKSEAWTRLFLKHAETYMVGAKDPDNTFKDFKNHCLHVGDTYWGGAPEQVVAWYGKTVEALQEQRWADAVYAAGVTSHYYTDPIHPFHTGQTEAENSIHRAAEWSINRSYNDLRKLGVERYPVLAVPVPAGPDWLKGMVCNGAEFSHRYYEKLIAHYDIHRGVIDPPAGLDGIARGIVAELLVYAATGFSRILEKAIDEAAVAPPHVELTLDTIMAAIKIPAKALAKRLSNAEDRKVVEAMYDELKATGRVDKTLPEDDRMVRDLHAKEVLAPKLAKQATERAARMKVPQPKSVAAPQPNLAKVDAVVQSLTNKPAAVLPPVAAPSVQPAMRVTPPAPVAAVPPLKQPVTVAAPPVTVAAPPAPVAMSQVPPITVPAVPTATSVLPSVPTVSVPTIAQAAAPVARPIIAPVVAAVSTPAPLAPAAPVAIATSVPSIKAAIEPKETAVRKYYLSEGDDLEAAPSIGPKMAERFASFGVKTVSDFLDMSPDAIAAKLGDRNIDGSLIEEWQYQALMVMEVAGLRGTHAQLLVGAGYLTAEAVALADPVQLSADVLKYATTTDGKRVLRDGNPPDIEKIKTWVSWAAEARAA